ncbi:MAG: tetratricopeptide repeat protein, partial [Acidobacteriota bacterium]|nr:tetratricopeptide repeat protein [Acidobacteriota bacterium]
LLLEPPGSRQIPEEVLTELARAVELEPNDWELVWVLSDRLLDIGRSDEALEYLDGLVETDPFDSLLRLDRARARLATGDLRGAHQDANHVFELAAVDHDRAVAFSLIGQALARQMDIEKANAAFESALAIEPDLTSAHFGLANIAGQTGRYREAVTSYRRVIAANPGHLEARLGEITALALMGQEAEAIERLERGRETLKDPPKLKYTLALLLLTAHTPSLRDPRRAVELAEQLVGEVATPDHGELLAVALAADGRYDEAAKTQQNLLDALPAGASRELAARWRARQREWQQKASDPLTQ